MEETVPSFYEEVSSRMGGETLTLCYQCGTCASSCPVARITTRFNPRHVIKSTMAGRKQQVISDLVWLCCSCYNCQERCPQGVEIAELMYTLRNIAVEAGFVRRAFIDMATSLRDTGRVAVVTRFTERRRGTLGLPPLREVGVEALQRIVAATSFSDTLATLKEAST
jgi:heterodisulfide reductase subunit C